MKNGLVFTTGFTKHSERQYSLRAPGHLDDPIVMVELDTSNGVMFPLYDPDANLIYLCGKVMNYLIIRSSKVFQESSVVIMESSKVLSESSEVTSESSEVNSESF